MSLSTKTPVEIQLGTIITDAFGVKWVVYAIEHGEPLLIGRIGRHDPALGGFPPGGADFHAGPTSGPMQLDDALAKYRAVKGADTGAARFHGAEPIIARFDAFLSDVDATNEASRRAEFKP